MVGGMNALQAALRSGRTPSELSSSLSLQVRQHPEFPQLHMFKYDQNSPMGDPICRSARGMILDESAGWEVVSWPFEKFFNYGEPLAASIDWGSACAQEKLDGSLMTLYHYAGAWRCASSGTPDGGGSCFGAGFTFADLFWRVFSEQGLQLPPLGWERFTFMFELMTPYNQVVVRHPVSTLKLIGCRDRCRGTEVAPQALSVLGWPLVQALTLGSAEAVQARLHGMDALKQEGFVVVDRHWNRVKMKCSQYVALHQLRGNGVPTPKRALEIILRGEALEVLTYWPEWSPIFIEVQQRLEQLQRDLETTYEQIQNIPMQKDFAAAALKSRYSSALFSRRSGKTESIHDYLWAMPVDRLQEVLQLQTMSPDVGLTQPQLQSYDAGVNFEEL